MASEAGVTRLTVYRHFADQDALFAACVGHWNALNPAPDLAAWRTTESLAARARLAFAELYAWYDGRHQELYPIHRDQQAMPASAQAVMAAQLDAQAQAIVGLDPGSDPVQAAVARHLVDFRTWQ